MESRRATLLAFATLLLSVSTLTSPVSAQYRAAVDTTLRVKAHNVEYVGVLQIVGEVGGQEQYRIGPDTIGLSIDVVEAGNAFEAEYGLDLGEGEAAVGSVTLSELGIDKDDWRPALEGLTLISFFPLPEGEVRVRDEWAELVTYRIAEIDLDFAEATLFEIQSVEGSLITVTFSAEGGGSTTIDRPMLGPDASMEITRESAREGSFVFDFDLGYVVHSERVEKTTTLSVIHVGGSSQPGPTETQTLTLELSTTGN
ncbi:MAG: hypothetical protein HOD00_12650 [Gemmatimonadales bacterium]|nr:hypothetical protein [Gemmatimonadales bacterium]MBT3775645.1 hypothetical protein [Gemmatimonadales bacterium]MBT3957573.1 hypothetical protein [Gemmatimonadales bacterium]MBT4187370.1 hypothetical protein [Gemmatimonadales bacterium]MBT4438364.1 hypothetical protein [Gemmatimonadales bacterium]